MKSIVFAAVLAAAPMAATAQQVTADDSFVGGTLEWSGAGRLGLTVGVLSSGGNVVLCGAYATIGGRTYRERNQQVLARSKIIAGDVILARNMNFFNQVSNAFMSGDMVGATTNCVNTGIPLDQVDLSQFELDFYEGPYR